MSVNKQIEDNGDIIENSGTHRFHPIKRRTDNFVQKVLTGKQKSIVRAFKKYKTNIALTCEACRISRSTFNNMREKNPLFNQAIEDEINAVDDLIETTSLKKALNDGDTQMLIFLLKTRLKNRGYVERTEQLVKSEQKQIVYDVKNLTDNQLFDLIERSENKKSEENDE